MQGSRERGSGGRDRNEQEQERERDRRKETLFDAPQTETRQKQGPACKGVERGEVDEGTESTRATSRERDRREEREREKRGMEREEGERLWKAGGIPSQERTAVLP